MAAGATLWRWMTVAVTATDHSPTPHHPQSSTANLQTELSAPQICREYRSGLAVSFGPCIAHCYAKESTHYHRIFGKDFGRTAKQ
jgi:hypothetical protein